MKTLDEIIKEIEDNGLEWELLGRYKDGDILRELEIRGTPEEVLKPFREYLTQPVPDIYKYDLWIHNQIPHSLKIASAKK